MTANASIDAAIAEVDKLLKNVRKQDSIQIRALDERGIVKATSLAWFNNHRPSVRTALQDTQLTPIDGLYKQLLSSSEKAASRSKTIAMLKNLKNILVALRSEGVIHLSGSSVTHTPDSPPDFAPLIKDVQMQNILARRWMECTACLSAKAPLAATVMMGGLLEALLLARVNHEPNKAAVFKAKTAPKDRKSGKTLSLGEWMLRNYIDVSHELGWISKSAKDVGEVLRDYRNYIHPYKELSHAVELNKGDAEILWEVCKSLSRQVISSV